MRGKFLFNNSRVNFCQEYNHGNILWDINLSSGGSKDLRIVDKLLPEYTECNNPEDSCAFRAIHFCIFFFVSRGKVYRKAHNIDNLQYYCVKCTVNCTCKSPPYSRCCHPWRSRRPGSPKPICTRSISGRPSATVGRRSPGSTDPWYGLRIRRTRLPRRWGRGWRS